MGWLWCALRAGGTVLLMCYFVLAIIVVGLWQIPQAIAELVRTHFR